MRSREGPWEGGWLDISSLEVASHLKAEGGERSVKHLGLRNSLGKSLAVGAECPSGRG